MRTASEIIVKKDYSKTEPTTLFYKDSPIWRKLLTVGFLVMIAVAGLGEWKTLNAMLGGLPKAVTAGIICMAIAYGIIYPDVKRLRSILAPTLMYMSLMALLLLWSMVIWIMSFSTSSTMVRACSKLMFQSISILAAVAGVYLFGAKAVDLFTIGVCMANGAIMLLEVPAFGVGPSIQSLITCLLTFGEADGYARQLEIHDLTFVFGQLVLYYAAYAPHDTPKENLKRWLFLIACIFFFLVGMKRGAIPAVILFIGFTFVMRRLKHKDKILLTMGVVWIAFFLVFIYAVRSGMVSQLLKTFNIDMMGRDYIWGMASEYYTFSITYMGHGFEYVDTIIGIWYKAGLINQPYPFHNDILKVFVELGFPGFMIWSVQQYVLMPLFWLKYADEETTLLYMAELSYMTFTYLTDNTAFYFWSTMALRIVALSYSVERKKPPKPQIWKPKDKNEMREHIRIYMMQDAQAEEKEN